MANAFFANWRQNIIYIGFVVIFLIFTVTLADKGLTPTTCSTSSGRPL